MAIKNNINRALALLIVAFVAALGTCQSAWAKNAHQAHNGACARSTSSIDKGLGDLKFNGVLGSFGKSLGFSKVNGSLLYQMRTRMTVGKIAKAVTTKNEGCNGKGGTFGAGKRRLYKGEKVAFAIPSEYSVDQVCPLGRTKGCKPVTVEEDVVLPVSCWNRNRKQKVSIQVTFWVRKSPDKKKPVAPVVTPPSTGSISQGDKVTETAEQECAARGSNWRWNTVTVRCEINQNSSTGGDSATTGNGSNTGGSTGGGGSQGGGGSGAGGNAGICSSQGGNGGGAGGTTGSGSGGNGGAGGSAGNVDCSTNVSGDCNIVNSPGSTLNCNTAPSTTPVDLCPNLSGTQQTVPGGMVVTWTGDCVANTCPPGEIRVTKSGANDSWGWMASGQAGLEYQVWYSAGLAFWGNQNQIPAGATPGTPACTKAAPSPSGGGGAPTSP